ncbi:transglycosylase [Limnohabitans sp. Rim8]|jgi:membrane-bound lytic murein transglycosylase A|uniref:peptidoglycan lytic exotransglycosylase n=1 Tax=Limnohabitans curvus TaxID=323423 RepID=A0A315EQ30_9BURK|nr:MULTISPECIES: MltA domain-containing protein [Limnohabitans]PUE57007.1 transglycosylase [Limnohabitans sp. Rim8]PUE59329.1 transglycosylase [Limnohabitans curvus]
MVHHTINTKMQPAPSASSKINSMRQILWRLTWALIVGSLVACGTTRHAPVSDYGRTPPSAARTPADAPRTTGSLAGTPGTPSPQQSYRSRWVAASWSEVPGWQNDQMQDAWNAWLQNCERPGPLFAPLCKDVRQLMLGSDDDRRLWMMGRLQPYRVESLDGASDGLLTSYYEPLFDASAQMRPGFEVPLYAPPEGLAEARRAGRPWFSRQEIDTNPQARDALRGREVAWLADPIDALVLHIQGSGRVRIANPDGTTRIVRLAFAGSNEQPYQSVGRWLLDRGLIRDASWPGIKAWIVSAQQSNPRLVQEMLWSNPRYVFFREETRSAAEADLGPRGAQGVPLTSGRSIAVDKDSIPYGTPVWLASAGPNANLQRLVFAQDTGSAIVGAVRADYFAGTGPEAGDFAGRMKQGLRLWVLWPK